MSAQHRSPVTGEECEGNALQSEDLEGLLVTDGASWPGFGITGIALTLFNILHTGGEQRKGLSPVLLFPVTFAPCGLDFKSDKRQVSWRAGEPL